MSDMIDNIKFIYKKKMKKKNCDIHKIYNLIYYNFYGSNIRHLIHEAKGKLCGYQSRFICYNIKQYKIYIILSTTMLL